MGGPSAAMGAQAHLGAVRAGEVEPFGEESGGEAHPNPDAERARHDDQQLDGELGPEVGERLHKGRSNAGPQQQQEQHSSRGGGEEARGPGSRALTLL